ncbi:MAG: TonB-dependent receptor [Bacteroidales bacterium]|nr:TonB-dependent receptor [Bacteroidales bacterium]
MKAKRILIFIAVFSAMQLQAQQVLKVADSTQLPMMQLDEVDIRSSKENTGLQELSASASTLEAKQIQNEELSSATELSSRVPNLFMPDYGSKLTSPIYIRGIGSRINSPSVGLYVDGVPYFEKAAFNFEFFDVERIEVLRGPQGTLYGRNTMGGIINVYTEKPGPQRKTDVAVYTGNYSHLKTQIGHDQPLGEHLSLGVDGLFVNHGGYFDNAYTGEAVDEMESYSGRVRLVYNPGNRWEGEYTMNIEISEQGGYPYAVMGEEQQTSNPVNYDRYSSYNRDMISNNFKLIYSGDNMVFKSITSHQYLDGLQEIDQDFTPASLLFVKQDQQQHMLSQEFNVQHKKGNYKAITGLFGFAQYADKIVDVDFGEDGIAAFGLPGPTTKVKNYDQTTWGAAAFHQSTWTNVLIDKLSFTAGMRVDYENARLDYHYDVIMGEKTIPNTEFNNGLDFFEVLPKASVGYEIKEDLSTYVTVSKGYKTGGFNSTFEREQDRTFDPEKSWNYETGVKSKWMDKRLMANFSLFYIDWKDQQIYQPVPSGQGSMLKNAGRSESKGMELELSAIPAPHLQAYASFGYTDARFVEYQEDEETDFSRNRIPYIPETTFSVGGNYKFIFSSKVIDNIKLNLNYQGIGKHYWDEANTTAQDYYGLLNSKVTLSTRWVNVGAWGKNLLDAEHAAFYFEALGNQYIQKGRPARFGIFVSASL